MNWLARAPRAAASCDTRGANNTALQQQRHASANIAPRTPLRRAVVYCRRAKAEKWWQADALRYNLSFTTRLAYTIYSFLAAAYARACACTSVTCKRMLCCARACLIYASTLLRQVAWQQRGHGVYSPALLPPTSIACLHRNVTACLFKRRTYHKPAAVAIGSVKRAARGSMIWTHRRSP